MSIKEEKERNEVIHYNAKKKRRKEKKKERKQEKERTKKVNGNKLP